MAGKLAIATLGLIVTVCLLGPTLGQSSPRTTKTSVSCTTPVTVNQASRCTATVTDNSNIGTPITPAGSVTFSSTGVGSLSPTSCTLSQGAITEVATCDAAFTSADPGSANVTANYDGDSTHSGSSTNSPASITVQQPTTTSVSCQTPIAVNQTSNCTATVDNISPSKASAPTGTVFFTSKGAGFLNTFKCTLSDGKCSVNFTGSSVGSASITGVYNGDSDHASGSSDTANVTVNIRTSSIVVSCITPVIVGQVSTCVATVADTSAGPETEPSGTVTFASMGPGSLKPTSCTMAKGSCLVTFTPSALGSATVIANYDGDTTHGTSTSAPTVITVPGPDFSLNARPTSLTISQDSFSSSTIILSTTYGYAHAVSLSASSPPGIIVSFSPASVYTSGGIYATRTSIMRITVGRSVPSGSYTIRVAGTSGYLRRHLNISLIVSLAPSPTPSTPTVIGLQPPVFYGVAAGVAVATIALSVVPDILRRRRRK